MGDYFDPSKDIQKHGTKLPHWQQGEVMQFVTFRLGDSMPAAKLSQWKQEHQTWLTNHPEPWDEKTENEYHTRFTRQLEDWLDEGHGSCLLRDPSHRSKVEEVLLYDHGTLAEHHAWVIMPNHLHLLFTPKHPLEKLMRKWKGISAHHIGKGSIWQRGYRDTLIRNARHFGNAVRYIRRNPIKLRPNEFTLWESEEAKKV
ncbi:transposase [Haloferula sp.]|uniref:transposase n=1 Tax=Haloferula sp. TaxID=2497595 RepID=UPI003C71ECCD